MPRRISELSICAGPLLCRGEFAVAFFPPHLKRRIREEGNAGKCWGVAFQVNELVMRASAHAEPGHGVDGGFGF